MKKWMVNHGAFGLGYDQRDEGAVCPRKYEGAENIRALFVRMKTILRHSRL
jgi:hypothetical protein